MAPSCANRSSPKTFQKYARANPTLRGKSGRSRWHVLIASSRLQTKSDAPLGRSFCTSSFCDNSNLSPSKGHDQPCTSTLQMSSHDFPSMMPDVSVGDSSSRSRAARTLSKSSKRCWDSRASFWVMTVGLLAEKSPADFGERLSYC